MVIKNDIPMGYSVFKYFVKTKHAWVALVVEGYCPSAMSVCTCKRPRAKTTVDHDRQGQPADGSNHAQWLRPLQVRTMHKRYSIDTEIQFMTSV